ncbi:MAG: hypothetical protein IPN94_12040 [Sphingobacteriales bacterium]|nr:hypothetical protein [Sphingobacteriales bacterium]
MLTTTLMRTKAKRLGCSSYRIWQRAMPLGYQTQHQQYVNKAVVWLAYPKLTDKVGDSNNKAVVSKTVLPANDQKAVLYTFEGCSILDVAKIGGFHVPRVQDH